MAAPTFAINLVPLVHRFHLQSVVLPESLHTPSHGGTYGLTDRPTELANYWGHRPDHSSRDAGVVVQMREKLLAIRVRLAQESLPVHEALLDAVREPGKTHILLFY